MKNLQDKQVQKGPSAKSLKVLIFAQIIIAIIAVTAIAMVSFKIKPLLEQKQKLVLDIEKKEAKKDSLTKEIQSLEEQKNSLQGALSRIDQKTVKTALESMVQENPDSIVVPWIYIHIFANEQRNKAKEISSELSRAGFIVPGIQKIDRSLNVSQVRYFRFEDESEAVKISYLLGKIIKKQPIINLIKGYEAKVQPRYFEIWFSPDAFKD